MNQDNRWGISLIRQRMLMWLENLLSAPRAQEAYPAIFATAQTLLEDLRGRWPDVEPMPTYPAFSNAKRL